MATNLCGICQKAFDSTSATEHTRWLLSHDCFEAPKAVVSAQIVYTLLGTKMLVVKISDGRSEFIFPDGKLFKLPG